MSLAGPVPVDDAVGRVYDGVIKHCIDEAGRFIFVVSKTNDTWIPSGGGPSFNLLSVPDTDPKWATVTDGLAVKFEVVRPHEKGGWPIVARLL